LATKNSILILIIPAEADRKIWAKRTGSFFCREQLQQCVYRVHHVSVYSPTCSPV